MRDSQEAELSTLRDKLRHVTAENRKHADGRRAKIDELCVKWNLSEMQSQLEIAEVRAALYYTRSDIPFFIDARLLGFGIGLKQVPSRKFP